jgi:CRP-like cAMP-binding protein
VATRPDIEFLRRIRIFQDIAEPHLLALWPRLRERRLRAGEVLFREGDPGDQLYLVRSGAVVVSKLVMGRVEQVLARMGPGDFFGEMSLFDGSPRSATIQAETEVVLLGLDQANLREFIEASPRAAAAFFYHLVQVFSQRLRASSALIAEVTRWGLEATGLDVEQSLPG